MPEINVPSGREPHNLGAVVLAPEKSAKSSAMNFPPQSPVLISHFIRVTENIFRWSKKIRGGAYYFASEPTP